MNRQQRRACAKQGHEWKHSENGVYFCANCGVAMPEELRR